MVCYTWCREGWGYNRKMIMWKGSVKCKMVKMGFQNSWEFGLFQWLIVKVILMPRTSFMTSTSHTPITPPPTHHNTTSEKYY